MKAVEPRRLISSPLFSKTITPYLLSFVVRREIPSYSSIRTCSKLTRFRAKLPRPKCHQTLRKTTQLKCENTVKNPHTCVIMRRKKEIFCCGAIGRRIKNANQIVHRIPSITCALNHPTKPHSLLLCSTRPGNFLSRLKNNLTPNTLIPS